MKYLIGALMWLFRLTWGILDTLVGIVIFLFFLIRYNKQLKIGYVAHCFVVELPHKVTDVGWGLSSGLFIFSNTNSIWNRAYLLYHEWGHCIPQTLALGPLHPFLVSIPSVIRFSWREAQARKGKELPPYDSVWFEGTATRWGTSWFTKGAAKGYWK